MHTNIYYCKLDIWRSQPRTLDYCDVLDKEIVTGSMSHFNNLFTNDGENKQEGIDFFLVVFAEKFILILWGC